MHAHRKLGRGDEHITEYMFIPIKMIPFGLGDGRHMLLECPALADVGDEFFSMVADCSGVMARLVWARDQPKVSRWIITCLDRMSC